MEARYWCLVVAIIQTLICAGPFVGWASIVLILQREGVYRYKCDKESTLPLATLRILRKRPKIDSLTRSAHCDNEDVYINLIFTVSHSVQQFLSLPLGIATDKMGPRFIAVHHFMCGVGALMMGLARPALGKSIDMFFVGCVVMSCPAFAAQASLYHVASLFPKQYTLVCTLLSATTGISCVIAPLLFIVWERVCPSVSIIFTFYSFVIFATLPFALMQPSTAFELGDNCRFSFGRLGFYVSGKPQIRRNRRYSVVPTSDVDLDPREISVRAKDDGLELQPPVFISPQKRSVSRAKSDCSTGITDNESADDEEIPLRTMAATTKTINAIPSFPSFPANAAIPVFSETKLQMLDFPPSSLSAVSASPHGQTRSVSPCSVVVVHPSSSLPTTTTTMADSSSANEVVVETEKRVTTTTISRRHSLSARKRAPEEIFPAQQHTTGVPSILIPIGLWDNVFNRIFIAQFIYEVIWLYIFSFYLGTINMQLNQLTTSQVLADWWIQLYSWVMPFGFIGSIGVGLIADQCSMGAAMLISVTISLVFLFFSCIPVLRLQILSFLANAAGEETVASLGYALTGRWFAPRYFCTLCGIIDVAFGIVNLTINPITALVVRSHVGFYVVQMIFFACGVVSVGFPLWIYNRSKFQQ